MWILSRLETNDKIIILPGRKQFSVGRSGNDLELKDDLSVSRAHAMFHITRSNLELEDCGSKFDTYHNDGIRLQSPVGKLERIPLQHGDRILFGRLRNIWHLSHFEIRTLGSALSRPQIEKLEISMLTLGGRVDELWSSSSTHLTMDEMSVTVKLLHALLDQKPVVSSNYWLELIKFANRGLFKGSLPNPENFPPKNIEEMNIGVRPERRNLFTGKTFVFMNRKHNETYGPIVKKAGGACKDLNAGVKTAFLTKDNVIVVQFVPSTQSQATETINSISGILERKYLRLIPEYEIGLAIVYCSIEKYCNPKYKLIKDILPLGSNSESQLPVGTMFVENTLEEDNVQTGARTEVVVPESEAVNKKNQNAPIEVIEINDEEGDNNCMPGTSKRDSNSNKNNNLKRKRQNQKPNNHYESDEEDELPIGKKGRKKNVIESDDDNDEEDLPLVQLKKNKLNEDDELPIGKKGRKKNVIESDDDNDEENLPLNHLSKNQHLDVEPKSSQSPRSSLRNRPTTDLNTKKVTQQAENKSPKNKLLVERPKNIPLQGFLEKSQTPALNNNDTTTHKRAHISVMTESDDDDDLFNFGDPNESQTTKKARIDNDAKNCDLGGELFNFDEKSTEPKNTEDDDEDDLKETEPFEQINSTKLKEFVIPKPKLMPSKYEVNMSNWLSCSLKLEDDKNVIREETVLKKEDVKMEPEHEQWLNVVKHSIVLGTIDVTIKSKLASLDQTDTSVCSNSTINHCKNFKVFSKTCLRQQKPTTIKLIPG